MDGVFGIIGMLFFAYCLRWQWDVPRGTFTEANFEEKKEQYEADRDKEVRIAAETEIVQNSGNTVSSEGKIRISPKMVERVKIGNKWCEVVDAKYFEITNQ